MSILKKFGTIVLKIIGIAGGFMPLIQQVTASTPTGVKVVDKVDQAFNAIVTAEQMFTAAYGPDAKKGSDKLKAAVPFVAALLQQTDLLAGHTPQNEALFQDASTRLTSALADILNSYGH